jgi:phenylacetate-CoA oxygenase PaaI subunit
MSSIDSASSLEPRARAALRDLLLSLADNKRLLGIRYSDRMLGAPTLETAVSAASMAQDEWGHSRLTYALLADFGDDPWRLEHEREAGDYRSLEVLGSPFRSWVETVAAMLLLDTALSIQYGALLGSRYAPARGRVQKMLDEEALHFQFATGWARRLAGSGGRSDFLSALHRLLPLSLAVFEGDPEAMRVLAEGGLVREESASMRASYLRCVGEVLTAAGVAAALGLEAGGPSPEPTVAHAGGGGPDAETLARVRGDLNRAVLLD